MSTSTNLTRAADCDACPAGFACGWATGSMSAAPVRCAAGFFCPEGTELPTQHPCPEGTYSNVTGLRAASEVSAMLRTTAPTHTRAQRAQRAQRSLSLSLTLTLVILVHGVPRRRVLQRRRDGAIGRVRAGPLLPREHAAPRLARVRRGHVQRR